MKKWYEEEYEFCIEVTGFLHGDKTERYKHIADSFDNAMKIGMEGLRNLSGEEC